MEADQFALPGMPDLAPEPPTPRAPRAPAAPPRRLEYVWAQTDHVCRACFGRVLVRMEEGKRTYRCSNCGAVAHGRDAACICACGSRLKTNPGGLLRCERNPDPRPEFPSEVVALQVTS